LQWPPKSCGASCTWFTRSGSPNSLLHFTLLTAIYLLNLLLRFFHNTGRIDWDFFYVNAFAVLAVSIVLGVWGFGNGLPC
jgi:hypothetical protein